jgi:hypothetical protein
MYLVLLVAMLSFREIIFVQLPDSVDSLKVSSKIKLTRQTKCVKLCLTGWVIHF